MKQLLILSVAVAAILCGCNPDKSSDIQTNVAPTGGKAYDAPKTAPTNSNVPAAARSAIPGGAK